MNALECKRVQFSSIGVDITYPYEILKTERNFTVFSTTEEYRNKFGENQDIVSYSNIKHAIKVAYQKLGLKTQKYSCNPTLTTSFNFSN